METGVGSFPGAMKSKQSAERRMERDLGDASGT